MKTNIYVLCGGKSVEHDISLRSASAIINAIDREKYNVYPIYITNEGSWCNLGLLEGRINNPDELRRNSSSSIAFSIGEFLTKVLKDDEKNLVFPALHGPNGEDGTIQGLLELLDIPYVGNEVLSSALAMDKVMTKDLLSRHNIPQVKYVPINLHNWKENEEKSYETVEDQIGYPCYIKPSNGGSSVGISRAENREELIASFKDAFRYDCKIIIEKELVAREMQISVVGNNNPKASVPGEFIMERPFFDYNAKYIDGKLIPVIPARLEPEVSNKVRETAVKAFKILNCYGLARVDIFVTDENEIFVNEVNTMPGFTAVSMTPVLWGATDGTTYEELIEKLINLALERYNEKKSIVNTR
ncbi:D-alanine--D-alanine ligase [Tissierella praeacuta]|uniref:D-alanine--D-alanine ligase n=1 Tax=Tissierella praeacuta TaxID=43131 RepID=UPI001050BFC0|nr:D-alanine--D-alanine ligase [Tissierella praeacuta]TCU77434.1 D-alanine--D-alanine ligase [Tissierella praeacuta]